jgi:hypothetical protein
MQLPENAQQCCNIEHIGTPPPTLSHVAKKAMRNGYDCEECSKLNRPLHTNTRKYYTIFRETYTCSPVYLPT